MGTPNTLSQQVDEIGGQVLAVVVIDPTNPSHQTIVDALGNMQVTLGSLIAGEDVANNVLHIEQHYNNVNINSAATTLVKSGAGYVDEIIIAGGTLGNVTIYDNTAASGSLLLPTVTPVSGAVVLKHCVFNTGLTIVTAAATVITGSYR